MNDRISHLHDALAALRQDNHETARVHLARFRAAPDGPEEAARLLAIAAALQRQGQPANARPLLDRAAVALAAVQLVPTLGRIADSPRKDLSSAHATLWSMPPARRIFCS